VTAHGDAGLRPFALKVLKHRAGSDAGARQLAEAVQRAYEDLARVSVPLISLVGLDALTGRALYRVQRTYQWLVPVHEATEWHGPFAHIISCLEQQEPAVAAEAAGAILATLTELLVTFIGEPLTARMLQDAWPDAFADTAPRRHQV
jgi:hypothetical protein